MGGNGRGRSGSWWALALGLLATAALVWLARIVAQWGDRTWVFLSIVAAVFAAFALAAWLIALVAPPLLRLLASLAKSAAPALAADPELQRLEARYPRFSAWLRRRLTLASPAGLYLTATVLIAVYFLVGFISIARDVAAASVITRYDVQVSALLRAFRTSDLTRSLWIFTILGDPRVASALTVLVVALLLFWGRRRDALLLGTVVGGAALLGALVKVFVHRPRPDAALALIKTPASFSFPSGHALYSMAFWGTVVFVVLRSRLRPWVKVVAVSGAALMISMTALSRVYLGVHWMSDVYASWLLGLAWLSACAGAYLIWLRYGHPFAERPVWTRAARIAATWIAVAVAVAVAVGGGYSDPVLARVSAASATREWAVTSVGATLAPTPSEVMELPRFSEKLDGTKQEPIGLIFVGSEQELVAAFERAGWSVADKPSPLTLLHAASAAISDRPYATGPVTPTFLDGNVQTIAFEKPEGAATVRRRHHTRWWKTGFTVKDEPVWVATASFDSRLEIGSTIPLPTHHIAPDIDAEQRYIVADLTRAGLRAAATVRVSEPTAGTDAQGDQWFTQGLATLLVPERPPARGARPATAQPRRGSTATR